MFIKEVWHEEYNSNKKNNTKYNRTPWINLFNLTDEDNNHITIHVSNKESFMSELFKPISEPELLFSNEILSVKMT